MPLPNPVIPTPNPSFRRQPESMHNGIAMATDNLLALLKRHFGYDHFRPGQEAIITNALAGRHGLVVMPTGGGKSLCYQLPALATGGLTLVISPLIALMQDQVDGLRANGIPAAFLNSSLDASSAAAVERSVQSGAIRLLYAAPERVALPGFRRFLQSLDLRLIAIDEAHCISEWGHDFRPDYGALSDLRTLFPNIPVMALTATATERVRQDIAAQLNLGDSPQFVSGFDRANLTYQVRRQPGAPDAVKDLLDARPGQSAIVYCFSRKDTEELAKYLTDNDHPALAYHAGLDSATRRRTQERFIDSDIPVIAATIAFGMGIDKPDIRLVVHYTLPKSVEGYYQETGRAGRDGQPSDCILFYADGDRAKQEFFIQRMSGAARATAETQLSQMVDYARLDTCRRRYLLDYFGDTTLPDPDGCGNCDVCLAERQPIDATVIAQKMLSAVIRTGERFGIAYINRVLLGSKDKRITELEHHQLSVFGIVNDYDRKGLRQIADGLIANGMLARAPGEYPTISVTDAGRQWLRSRQPLTLQLRVDEPATPLRRPDRNVNINANANPNAAALGINANPNAIPPNANAAPADYDTGLFDHLRALRRRLADAQGVPAFVVFSDAHLRNLAAARPDHPAAMLQVSGVGPAKLEQYGDDFLTAIREYAAANPRPAAAAPTSQQLDFIDRSRLDVVRQSHPRAYESWTHQELQELQRRHNAGQDIDQIAAALGRQPSAISARLNRLGLDSDSPGDSPNEPTLSATHFLTRDLLHQGLTIAEIARERNFTPNTIMSHLQRLANAGEPLNLTHLLPPPSRITQIETALQSAPDDRLGPVKESLGDDYTYDEIRLVRIAAQQRK